MLHNLAQMQSTVKGTCTLVDEAYSDKLLPKDIRQELKNEAINILDEYAKLMVALEAQQNKQVLYSFIFLFSGEKTRYNNYQRKEKE